MAIRVVRLGSPRHSDEELRIGTVRRPPRGVPKEEIARRDFYDVWFPNLAPTVETMKLGQAAASAADWARFRRRYRAEMATPESRHALALLSALSHRTNLAVGCYCADETRCHRSVLRDLLAAQGAALAD